VRAFSLIYPVAFLWLTGVLTVMPKFFYYCNIRIFFLENRIVLHYLKEICIFIKFTVGLKINQLIDLIVIDFPERSRRFDLIYLFQTIRYNARHHFRFSIMETSIVPSLTNLYLSSSWSERESWDMFGVMFKDHFDLRRILTDYGFIGFPLRKDFPLTGYLELFYNDVVRRITREKISLAQAFRYFEYQNPWLLNINDSWIEL
jgi:NADH-quinone oxidoreductase subunit C